VTPLAARTFAGETPAAGASAASSPLPSRPAGTARRRRVAWLPLGVLLLAALLRLWQIGRVPPGLQFDEAHNAIDAVRVLDGSRDVFFTENGGREPFIVYLQACLLALLGRAHPAFALRLASAFVGIVTVAVLYRAFGELAGDRRVGLLAAAYLAVSYWHLHFSRYGIRAILAPLWTTAALWAWWRATREGAAAEAGGTRQGRALLGTPRARWALACGACLAAAAYSHPTGRLAPLILCLHVLYRLLARRPNARTSVWVLGAAGATAGAAPSGAGDFRSPRRPSRWRESSGRHRPGNKRSVPHGR
jgi:4-amino-4-deoxy-L-arabinose transferase-like glycosyltransferase